MSQNKTLAVHLVIILFNFSLHALYERILCFNYPGYEVVCVDHKDHAGCYIAAELHVCLPYRGKLATISILHDENVISTGNFHRTTFVQPCMLKSAQNDIIIEGLKPYCNLLRYTLINWLTNVIR